MKGKPGLVGRSVPEQTELPGTEAADGPQTVHGRIMLVRYVRPHYKKDNKDNYSLSLEFSLALTKEHDKLPLPEWVRKYWKIIKGGGSTEIGNIDIPPQSIDIHEAPDMEPRLRLMFTKIENAQLKLIEESGSGKNVDVIRFSFRANHESFGPNNRNLRDFADNEFDRMVWISLSEVQGKLLKEHEAAEAAGE